MKKVRGPGVRRRPVRFIRRKLLLAKAIGAVMLLGASLASANIVVTPGADNTDTDNVLSNACTDNASGPALIVQGCLNTNHDFLINFVGHESMAFTGGQASITAVDDAFSFLEISLGTPEWTFNKLLLNIDALEDGFVTFFAAPGGASAPFALSKNGANKFTVTGDDFLSVAFTTTSGVSSMDLVADLKQVRIGGQKGPGVDPDPIPMPVPGSLMLLALGLLSLKHRFERDQHKTA